MFPWRNARSAGCKLGLNTQSIHTKDLKIVHGISLSSIQAGIALRRSGISFQVESLA